MIANPDTSPLRFQPFPCTTLVTWAMSCYPFAATLPHCSTIPIIAVRIVLIWHFAVLTPYTPLLNPPAVRSLSPVISHISANFGAMCSAIVRPSGVTHSPLVMLKHEHNHHCIMLVLLELLSDPAINLGSCHNILAAGRTGD